MKREQLLEKARPILFNTDMVRAIIDGRKTVTRRLMKPQPMFYNGRKYIFADDVCPKQWQCCSNIIETYKYQPGDILMSGKRGKNSRADICTKRGQKEFFSREHGME